MVYSPTSAVRGAAGRPAAPLEVKRAMPGSDEAYVGAVLVATLVLLLVLRLRAELVALVVLIALEISGILTRDEALSGFSNSAVITIVGVFVLSAALERTGVAD